jgi:hypothetical protein
MASARGAAAHDGASHVELIEKYERDLVMLVDRVRARTEESARGRGPTDTVRIASPALDLPLAGRSDVLDVDVVLTQRLNVQMRPLRGGKSVTVNDLQGSGESVTNSDDGTRIDAACPTRLTDAPDAVDLTIRRSDVWLVLAVRAPGVCTAQDQAMLKERIDRAKRFIGAQQALYERHLEATFDACPPGHGRSAPPAGPLKLLPGFEDVHVSCREANDIGWAVWPKIYVQPGPPPEFPKHGGATTSGGFHPRPGVTFELHRYDDGAQEIFAEWNRTKGESVQMRVTFVTAPP